MHLELLCVTVTIRHNCCNAESSETLKEFIVAPSKVIGSFADFITHRDGDETVSIKNDNVRFEDIDITCSDSRKVVDAYQYLQSHDMYLNDSKIFQLLIDAFQKKYTSDERWKNFMGRWTQFRETEERETRY